ncbi:hypothetical protein OG455_32950 [Kitasatospora sp. NBC_01287]|uniref:hypothetical protein n=1 Tax=Kitasatospora sp. NBC_01287 TaxID=2903573 RepID=UPI00224F8A33|nr:hypothetical protein [Kitasatospora sp. NBC_01287]MCX4750268.1 hypothetical protein [Kitasatospora sp. NBC_01287]
MTVELTGVAPPAWFAELADALAAAWGAMKLLPLDNANYCAFELMLARPGAVAYMTERLECDGAVGLTFVLPDGPHRLWVRPDCADCGSSARALGSAE